jgi:2-phosphoglycerate kinase
MNNNVINKLNFELPKGFIVFISGVPGVGKTTISYELLKMFDEFRIVEETDLIREILRGYNEYIKDTFKDKALFLFEEIEITHNTKFLQYDEAKKQCEYMKKSFEKIIGRQKRKGISTIINGVHIVPEILNGLYENENIIYFNLYVNNEHTLFDRWGKRDPTKYTIENLSTAFQTNAALSESTQILSKKSSNIFNDIDITDLNVEQTKIEIIRCIANRLQNFQA